MEVLLYLLEGLVFLCIKLKNMLGNSDESPAIFTSVVSILFIKLKIFWKIVMGVLLYTPVGDLIELKICLKLVIPFLRSTGWADGVTLF